MRAIVKYTFEAWGADQAVLYSHSMRTCFQTLAKNPGIGRACDGISSGLHRHEQGKHVVFYRLKQGGVRIVRILHQRMIPVKQHFKE
jgi:toxin ParE1/3/4